MSLRWLPAKIDGRPVSRCLDADTFIRRGCMDVKYRIAGSSLSIKGKGGGTPGPPIIQVEAHCSTLACIASQRTPVELPNAITQVLQP
jgi:hypothetical protein